MQTKWCSKCREDLSLDSFWKDTSRRDGLYYRCKSCQKEYDADYRKKNAEHIREQQKEYDYKYYYDLPSGTYGRMHAEQDGKCAICKRSETMPSGKIKALEVDHCHRTGKVEALLCHSCNSMLGYAKDDPEVLERALEYIKKYRNKEKTGNGNFEHLRKSNSSSAPTPRTVETST